MIYLSVALVLIFAMVCFVTNKYINLLKFKAEHDNALNIKAAEDAAAVLALKDQINTFDKRINDTWFVTSSITEEMGKLKLHVGLRNQK